MQVISNDPCLSHVVCARILDIRWTRERMARIIKDVALETRAARERLKPRGKPYYRIIEEGLHLGYRKPRSGAGKWVLRHYVGDQSYTVETLAPADDLSESRSGKNLSRGNRL